MKRDRLQRRSLRGRAAASLVASLFAAIVLTTSGCATTRSQVETKSTAAAGVDPIEPVNSAIFLVNEKIDKAVLNPLAQGYAFLLPMPVRSCISNVFANVADVPISLNWVNSLSTLNPGVQAPGHSYDELNLPVAPDIAEEQAAAFSSLLRGLAKTGAALALEQQQTRGLIKVQQ